MDTSFSQLSTYNRCRRSWWLRYQEKIERLQLIQPLELGSAIHAGIAAVLTAKDIVASTIVTKTLWKHIFHFSSCTHCGASKDVTGYKHRYGTICTKCYHKLSVSNKAAYAPAVSKWAQDLHPGWRAEAKKASPTEETIDLGIVEAVELAEIVELALEILEFCVPTILGRFDVVHHPQTNKPLIEYPFIIETPYGPFRGVIDAVLVDKTTGIPFVVDFKTTAKITDSDAWFDLQTLMYGYWLHQSDIKTTGAMIYQIKSSMPKKPALTKKGAMNRTAISTSWEVYKACLIENGLDPADYKDMEIKLAEKRFINVQKVYRSADQSQTLFGVLEQIKQMSEATETTCYRSISRYTCNSCEYGTWCMAELEGSGPAVLLGSSYIKPVDSKPKIPTLTAKQAAVLEFIDRIPQLADSEYVKVRPLEITALKHMALIDYNIEDSIVGWRSTSTGRAALKAYRAQQSDNADLVANSVVAEVLLGDGDKDIIDILVDVVGGSQSVKCAVCQNKIASISESHWFGKGGVGNVSDVCRVCYPGLMSLTRKDYS